MADDAIYRDALKLSGKSQSDKKSDTIPTINTKTVLEDKLPNIGLRYEYFSKTDKEKDSKK